ncbi:hypothetical protein IM792_11960 [Mucilaginibacter sp. JRF]|uniref:hypothetical protein n=1 Tax=Mucilaginibacter sp. JRF TaxID=2780088 RepID=UPI001881FA00|nr:hypothetical protein [Mucilaginibacter sp. JRF]MBE9585166.1 hypothetical protein [Mucilaginibacter sp. JRF]
MTDTDKNKDRAPEDKEIKVAKIAAWQAIIIAVITTAGGYFVAKISAGTSDQNPTPVSVTPKQNTNLVNKLPEEKNSDLYELRKDISIFDLRQ